MDGGHADSGRPTVTGRVVGLVTDVRGNRLEGVDVTLAGRTARSSDDGQFSLGAIPAGTQQALVATLEGFSSGRVRVDVLDDQDQLVKIVLQRAEMATLADPSAGGMVETPSGVTLQLPANAIVDAQGNAVTGPVEMAIALLNDRDEILAAPGGLLAVDPDNASGDVTPLESFGMVEVTLTAGGEEVNIREGVDVDLVFPLAPNHGFADGDPIALWHFDETDEAWKQVGEGIVEGDSFRAVVSHFSWWNADQIMTKTCVVGRVLDASGTPVGGAQMTAEGRSYLGSTRGTSESDGSYCIEARVGSVIELSTVITVGGSNQALAVNVSTPRGRGSCGEPDSCFEIQDLVAVAEDTQPLCEPSACPQEDGKEACCMTELGPCNFVVNGDCGGNADGSWDAPPDEPGVAPIDGVPMPLPPGVDGGVPQGGSGGMTGSGGMGGESGMSGGASGASGEGGEGGESGEGGEGGGGSEPDASVALDGGLVDDEDAGDDGQGGGGGTTSTGSGGAGSGAVGGAGAGGSGGAGAGGAPGGVGGVGGGGAGGTGGAIVDRCDDAIELDGLEPVNGTTSGSTLINDWWDQGACYSYLPGFERVYAVTVPGEGTLRARAIGAGARVVIARACEDVNGSCEDAGSTAVLTNMEPGEITAYVIVDNAELDAQIPFTLFLATGPESCGDGILDDRESCDDGGRANGDGCDGQCEVEDGYYCSEDGACSEVVCGDGIRQNPDGWFPGPSERCDDGQEPPQNGDGCSVTCQVEPGFVCDQEGEPCRAIVCGDGVIDGGGSQGPDPDQCNPNELTAEQCDDADGQAGDGCDASCKVEVGFVCSGEPSTCEQRPSGDLCSNPLSLATGVFDLTGLGNDFQLSDGPDLVFRVNVPADQVVRIAGTAQFEGQLAVLDARYCGGMAFGRYLAPGEPFSIAFSGDVGEGPAGEGSGDVLVVFAAWDGSSDFGLTLSSVTVGAPVCGDGIVTEALEEQCDDGDSDPDDGCDENCRIEDGYACNGPGECRPVECNDGSVDWPSESCEDGNTMNGDGCSSSCRTEPGTLCAFWQEPVECETRPAGDLCNNASVVPPGLHVASYSLEGMTTDAIDCQECDVTRWLAVTVQPGHTLTAAIQRASFYGQLALHRACPESGMMGGGDASVGISPNDPGTVRVHNDGSAAATWFVELRAMSEAQAGELDIDLAIKTGAPGCGDGFVAPSEACDDMNGSDGDGCDSDCQLEAGNFDCPPQGGPCVAAACGDGRLFQMRALGYEECDDDGTSAGDGCDGSCRIEPGALCSGEPSLCRTAAAGEVCTTAHALASGSSMVSLFEPADDCTFDCDPQAWLSFTLAPRERIEVQLTAPVSGSAELIAIDGSDCRDGLVTGTTGFGMAPGAALYAQNDSNAPIAYRIRVRSYDNVAGAVQLEVLRGIENPELCGNNMLDGNEQCDDGDAGGDGCTAACVRELGAYCAGEPSVCSVRPIGDLCENAQPLATGHYGLTGYTSENGPGGWFAPTRWLHGSIQPGQSIRLTVSSTDIGQGFVRVFGLRGGCSFLNAPVIEQVLTTGSPVVITHANGDPFPVTFAVQLGESEPGASTAGFDVTFTTTTSGCGDGYVDREGRAGAPEACDDGDATSGDGCSAACKPEAGYGCVGDPSQCSLRAAGDVCSSPLPLATGSYGLDGFVADYGGPPSGADIVLSASLPEGDVLNLAGTASFTGMLLAMPASACGVQGPGVQLWLEAGQAFQRTILSDELGYNPSGALRIVIVSYDAPGPTTTIGFTTASVTTPFCGDGNADHQDGESCDDGDDTGGDGCSSSCHIEPGFACPSEGGECHEVVCGDGIVERGDFGPCAIYEECDDGDNEPGDGCDAGCRVEDGFACAGEPSTCVVPAAGDACETAQPLANGTFSLSGFLPAGSCEVVCGGADRWLTVQVPGGQHLTVDAATSSSNDVRIHLFDATNGCAGAEIMQITSSFVSAASPANVQWINHGSSPRTIAVVLEDPAAGLSNATFNLSYSVEATTSGCAPGQVVTCNQDACVPSSWLADQFCDAELNCPMYGFDEGDCGGGAGGIGGAPGGAGGIGGSQQGGFGGFSGGPGGSPGAP